MSGQQPILIPKIFHQIWVGPKPLPHFFEKYRATWKARHPHWEFKLWKDSDVPNFQLKNIHEYEDSKSWAQKADILRYEILQRFGGIYLDVDFECFKGIEPLLGGISAFSAEEIPGRVAIGIMGATSGHEIFNKAVNQLPTSYAAPENIGSIIHQTGPDFFAQVIASRSDICLYPREYFYPYYYDEKIEFRIEDYPQAFAAHHWMHSWKPSFGERIVKAIRRRITKARSVLSFRKKST